MFVLFALYEYRLWSSVTHLIFVFAEIAILSLTYLFLDKPSATRSSSTIKLELGEDRSIGCPVDIGNPPAVITWYRGNRTNGNKTTNSSTLEVQNAALSDEEWYTCFAKNELGNTTVNLLLMIGKLNRIKYDFRKIIKELVLT